MESTQDYTTQNETNDFFCIGTPATCQIKVYFNSILDEDALNKINRAIKLWKNSTVISGKAK